MSQPAGLYFVQLDLDEIRGLAARHLDRTSPPDNDDLVEWLLGQGFRLTRGGWQAGPAAMDLLHPAAIRYCEPIRGGPPDGSRA